MSRHANAARFGDGTTPGDWYNPPYPTTIESATNWMGLEQRATWLHEQFPTITKIGIAGAGFGITGYYLYVNYAKDVYMCDIEWATVIGSGTLGSLKARLGAHDVTTSAGADGFRRMGNTGKSKYPLVFTEDLLPCANDEAEAQAMLTNLRGIATTLVHLVTPQSPEAAAVDILWRTPEQWRTIIGPNERIILPSLVEVP